MGRKQLKYCQIWLVFTRNTVAAALKGYIQFCNYATHALYVDFIDIFKLCRTRSYILPVPGGGKNIPFTLDKLHPEIRENKMSLKGPQQSTSLVFTTVKQLLTWLPMDKVLHNITVLHPTYTVQ